MNILLRELQLSDKEHFFLWLKDKDVIKYSLSIFLRMTKDSDISQWFDNLLSDRTSFNKAIVDIATDRLIGYAGIAHINNINSSGEYFIFIGDKTYHGKGIGTLVTKEIVRMGFQELNLHRIMLTVSDENKGAIKAYAKANFKTEGVMKQACFRDDKYHDKIIMAILREEWLDTQ